MKRLGRFRFMIYALLALLLLLGGTRWYLTSSYAAARVADKLSADEINAISAYLENPK